MRVGLLLSILICNILCVSAKTTIGKMPERAERVSFISPNPDEELDWVLIIDDASKKYKRP